MSIERQAPQQRGDDDQQGAGIERLEAGTEDHEGADEAARDGRPAPPTEHLAEEERAEEGGEERAVKESAVARASGVSERPTKKASIESTLSTARSIWRPMRLV